MSQLDAAAPTAATSSTGVPAASQSIEQVLQGIALSGLTSAPEYAMDAMEGQAVRPLNVARGRRVLTVGVDSGAAATVVPAGQFADYPLEPNSLSLAGKATTRRTASGSRTKARDASLGLSVA